MQKLKWFFLSMIILKVTYGQHQDGAQMDGSAIYQALQKLNTVGSVLYIAAHPDDENTRLLAYLAGEKKLRTGYLSLTRGDGGQNLIGKEKGPLLGLIRTQELLAARRLDGAEQFFTRAIDFGYSKTPEETLSKWERDSVLYDMVYIIRKFRPDVIICRFPETGEGGHGHHTASAILTRAAFAAAKDSSRFPDQLKNVAVWKARRLFWNTFNFGETNTIDSTQLKMDVGAYNAILGKGYGEIAAKSRSMHKSQGFGASAQRGSYYEYFKLLEGDKVQKDLFEGIETDWNRIETGKNVEVLIDKCIKNFQIQHPEKSVPLLAQIYSEISVIPEKGGDAKYWKIVKINEVKQILFTACGLFAEVLSERKSGCPGTKVWCEAKIIARSSVAIGATGISCNLHWDSVISKKLLQNIPQTFRHELSLPGEIAYSSPYWLGTATSQKSYRVPAMESVGKAENDAPIIYTLKLEIAGVELEYAFPLTNKITDPTHGERLRSFQIVPPVTLHLPETPLIFSARQKKTIRIFVESQQGEIKGALRLHFPTGWKANVKADTIHFRETGEKKVIEVEMECLTGAQSGALEAFFEVGGKSYGIDMRQIEYDHIPPQFVLFPSTSQLMPLDLHLAKKKIAYIQGSGDEVMDCLKSIGYDVTELNEGNLEEIDLKTFSAIITGIRAYNVHPFLQNYYQKFMRYIKWGGNFIVQYNTNNRIGPVGSKIGPYSFTISRNRVTDENSEIRFADTGNVVLNSPNRIREKDFQGWVQERGIYFADKRDAAYKAPLQLHDHKEEWDSGSLIVAPYGKGNFIYTGLSFFRQLPAGVAGAYKLMVNILSLPTH